MKKLLALTVVASLLGLITGCPPPASTPNRSTKPAGITTGTTVKNTAGGPEKKTETSEKTPDGTEKKTETKSGPEGTDKKTEIKAPSSTDKKDDKKPAK